MSALDINSYIADGFSKVCDVCEAPGKYWFYKNIDKTLMFSKHRSWVYFILVDNTIVKVGETGNPLGIKASWSYDPDEWEWQPIRGSRSRFGRYRYGDTSDEAIRWLLSEEVQAGRVSLWARMCEMVETEILIGGQLKLAATTFHKELELHYLDHIVQETGSLPYANKSRK